MIKYDASSFNDVIIDIYSFSIECELIKKLSNKISSEVPRRPNRINKTIVTKSSLGEINLTLNKITHDNYSQLIDTLLTLAKSITSDADTCEILSSITTRTMFTELYTKIFLELIPINYNFLNEAKKDFARLYDELNGAILLISDKTDYINLCKNNKTFDTIKHKINFYTSLSSHNLDTITVTEIHILIGKLLLDLNHYVKIEIVYNIISLNMNNMKENDKWGHMLTMLNDVKNKRENYADISNKILFKTMDILDIIENQI